MHGGLLGGPFCLSVRLSVHLSETRQKLLDNNSYRLSKVSVVQVKVKGHIGKQLHVGSYQRQVASFFHSASSGSKME